MDERIKALRDLEPNNSGRASYLAILEAAAGLFAQFPARDITLRDILSISGVSNQTLYNYFPNGRDDIAIALYDRFQKTMVDDFNSNILRINFDTVTSDAAIIVYLGACLPRAVFGFLRETYPLQSTIFDYLGIHNLRTVATHMDELEEALARELDLRFGPRMAKSEQPRIVRLCVSTVRGIAEHAMLNKDFSLDELESNARKVVRSLLKTGFPEQDPSSGSHDFRPYASGSVAILGAPISPIKRQGILERIMKRKKQG